MSAPISAHAVVTEMRVIPVAGHDSMLLNLSGAHGPFFTRNIVILKDSAGHTGVGEVPGGEAIRRRSKRRGRWSSAATRRATTRSSTRCAAQFADRDTGGRGVQTFDLRTTIHAVTAHRVRDARSAGPVPRRAGGGAAWRGHAARRGRGARLLFFVGDRDARPISTTAAKPDADDDWFRLAQRRSADAGGRSCASRRRRSAVRLQRFKLKGGVLARRREMRRRSRLAERFPDARITLDPNGAWSLEEAIRLCRDEHDVLAYAEDPCGARTGNSGREVMAEFRRATGMPTATNMVATDWRAAGARDSAAGGRHPARRSAFLDDGRVGARRADVRACGVSPGDRIRTITSTFRSRCSRTSPRRRRAR